MIFWRNLKLAQIVKTKAIDINLSDKVVNSSFGEETKRDQLVVMGAVSGLADESKKFANLINLQLCLSFSYNLSRKGQSKNNSFANKYF